MNQDATWHGGRPRSSHIVRWGPSSPTERRTAPPLFGPCLLWPNGRPSQQHCWYLVRILSLADLVVNLHPVTWSITIPSNVKRVSTLPCETLVLKNGRDHEMTEANIYQDSAAQISCPVMLASFGSLIKRRSTPKTHKMTNSMHLEQARRCRRKTLSTLGHSLMESVGKTKFDYARCCRSEHQRIIVVCCCHYSVCPPYVASWASSSSLSRTLPSSTRRARHQPSKFLHQTAPNVDRFANLFHYRLNSKFLIK